ncbi:hydroxypyruvate isomerase family protein [Rhodococcoides fascians]|jgi:hydroxypyruvate isomerase|uniref:hydroxypyruvate isomerase family protein n=1 Tax=Rhodococcoides fascians TaxID=1828 RepID=UPI0009B87C98|nr:MULTISPECIES: TIM barrel protein [Rhodococcus]OZF00759.1 hypothetical protein CH301_11950 [Rhodococcus sp. 15-1189-1-1a]OZF21186.1 hypothetical protein CH299_02935 [Rhodococcus sp. 14-2686-1-2]
MKTSPNLSLLWQELPFAERFHAARDRGFEAIEFWPWEDHAVVATKVEELGLHVSILNVDPGPAGAHGQLANPDATEWWQNKLDTAVEFARRVGCTTINTLVGNRLAAYSQARQLETAARNLAEAAERIDGSGVDMVIEPLSEDRPTYLTRTVRDARALMQAAGSPESLHLLFDFYHLAQTEEDSIERVFVDAQSMTKHVQLADFPGRHEPGSGTIAWSECRRAIDNSTYTGWIGLEFSPSTTTEDALDRFDQAWKS